jgi:hypothetical protein
MLQDRPFLTDATLRPPFASARANSETKTHSIRQLLSQSQNYNLAVLVTL